MLRGTAEGQLSSSAGQNMWWVLDRGEEWYGLGMLS